MIDTTPKGLLKLLTEGAQNAVVANENSLWLEFALHRRVEDRDLTAPPALTAGDAGKVYIVAAGASGAWAGRDGQLALWDGVAWLYLAPVAGLALRVADEDRPYRYDGALWQDAEPAQAILSAVAPLGGATRLQVADETLAGLAGASVASGFAFPAGAIVLGVSARVTAAITGAASYDLGWSGEAALFGAALPVGQGNVSLGPIAPRPLAAATAVTVTANGADFTGGSLALTYHYLTLAAAAVSV